MKARTRLPRPAGTRILLRIAQIKIIRFELTLIENSNVNIMFIVNRKSNVTIINSSCVMCHVYVCVMCMLHMHILWHTRCAHITYLLLSLS